MKLNPALTEDSKLSDNFFRSEVTASQTAARLGIRNEPSLKGWEIALKAAHKLEEVRALLRHAPLNISSWYRSPELNVAVGGSRNSQHVSCEAVDFTARRFGTPQQICAHLQQYADQLQFDQLIFEHTWVHISFALSGSRVVPRKQVLTLLAGANRYAAGITDKQGNPLYT